jgi:uncharacterized membrane protein
MDVNQLKPCLLTGELHPLSELMPVSSVRGPVIKLIRNDFPDLDADGYVSVVEVNKYRLKYFRGLIEKEYGKLTDLEEEVLEHIGNSELLSENIEPRIQDELTLGQKLADKIASFGGSWYFIILFGTFMFIWICINTYVLVKKPFDPYPFILLNLMLSCLAAIQAPVIMMSQNRKEEKDRYRSEHDYQINLKAELEIRQINEKIDHLLNVQAHKFQKTEQQHSDIAKQIDSINASE